MAKRITENFPPIPGLPAGWRLWLFGQSEREPRQAVVVCRLVSDDDLEWVCWRVNMVEGGCYMGYYKHTAAEAEAVFNERYRELERIDSPAAQAPRTLA